MEHTLPPSMQRPSEPTPEVKPVTTAPATPVENILTPAAGALASASKVLPQKLTPSGGDNSDQVTVKENSVPSGVAQPPSLKSTQGTTAKEATPPPIPKLPPTSAVTQNVKPPPPVQTVKAAPPLLPTEHGMITSTQNKPIKPMKTKALKPQRPSSLTTAARKFRCNYCPYKGLYQSEVRECSFIISGGGSRKKL